MRSGNISDSDHKYITLLRCEVQTQTNKLRHSAGYEGNKHQIGLFITDSTKFITQQQPPEAKNLKNQLTFRYGRKFAGNCTLAQF